MRKQLLSFALLSSSLYYAQTWNLTGNSGTNPSTNYLGTVDAQDMVMKTEVASFLRAKVLYF